MTNAEIIFREAQELAKQGIIHYTGRIAKMQTPDGQIVEIKETEPIHTYQAWKDLGYQVQKGQKAIAQFIIWKCKSGKENEDGSKEKDKMFMKKASFFTRSQVEAIQ